jgi:hypothetical protein
MCARRLCVRDTPAPAGVGKPPALLCPALAGVLFTGDVSYPEFMTS